MSKLSVVGGSPGPEEELLGRPFADRAGEHLRRLLSEAGLPPDACHLCYAGRPADDPLAAELRREAPAAVLCLGHPAARAVLGKRAGGKLADLAGDVFRTKLGRRTVPVAVWHDPHRLLLGGKKSDEESVKFFQRVRGLIDA